MFTPEHQLILDRLHTKLGVVVDIAKITLLLAATHLVFVTSTTIVRLYNETRNQGYTLQNIRIDVGKLARDKEGE